MAPGAVDRLNIALDFRVKKSFLTSAYTDLLTCWLISPRGLRDGPPVLGHKGARAGAAIPYGHKACCRDTDGLATDPRPESRPGVRWCLHRETWQPCNQTRPVLRSVRSSALGLGGFRVRTARLRRRVPRSGPPDASITVPRLPDTSRSWPPGHELERHVVACTIARRGFPICSVRRVARSPAASRPQVKGGTHGTRRLWRACG